MEKSSLIHTALFCKGWYKIKYLHDAGSFKEFVDNLWKNMAIYLEEDCMYEFKTQDQVIHKLLKHLDYTNVFKNDNCRIGKLPWLYEEVKRIQTYCKDIDFEAAKRNEIGSFVEAWMDLELVIQSELREREMNIVYERIYVKSRKMV